MSVIGPIVANKRSPWKWLFTSSLFPTTLTAAIEADEAEQRKKADKKGKNKQHVQSDTGSQPQTRSKNPEVTQHENRFLHYLKYRFLLTWGIKGHDLTTNTITCADGTVAPYTSNALPLRFVITALLGLPNRPGTMIDGVPQLSVLDVLRGLIGGWTPIRVFSGDTKKAVWTDKTIWQIVAIPIKIGVILPVNLLLILPRIVHNAAKFFTEFLLPTISLGLAGINIGFGLGLKKSAKWAFKKTETVTLGQEEDNLLDESRERRNPLKIIAFIFFIFPIMLSLTVATTVIQYASVWACRAGLALTSPVESARRAYALGRNFTVGKKGSRKREVVSTIVGVLGVLVSLSASAVLWTIAFPFAISTLTTLIPQLLTLINGIAQLPFIATSLTTISQWPLVSGSLFLLNKLFATVGVGLSQAFGPAIITMASAFGAQVTPAVLAVCTTLGMLGTTFIAIPISWAAGVFSNAWASWTGLGPMTTYINKPKTRETSASQASGSQRYVHLDENKDNAKGSYSLEPTSLAYNLSIMDKLYRYRDQKADNTPQVVVSPVPLDIVNKNQHLLEATTLYGVKADQQFERAKNLNDPVYRLPTIEELTKEDVLAATRTWEKNTYH